MQDDNVADVDIIQSRLDSVSLLFPDHRAQVGIGVQTSIGHGSPDKRPGTSILQRIVSEMQNGTRARLTPIVCFLLESISLPAALATLAP